MKINIIGVILVILIIIISIRIYNNSDYFNLKCIISDVDGNKYCVRERSKLKLAANKLAKVNKKLIKLVNYCKENYSERDNVKRLVNGFNPKKICETLPTSKYTAYSENKGEKIALCLDKEKNGNGGLIDDNTLIFVAIHEVSHIATKSVGHNDEFWSNFKFLLGEASKIGIYKPIDYKRSPKRYCGIKIKDSPYYDY
jgi:hypothetical protein